MERFDALAEKSDERLLVLTGEALSRAPDAELQRIVAEVAEALEMPTALVSLVLTRTQYFRAQVGLPPDLANVAATDRDVSFCQFVVRDEAPLVVEDAKDDPKFPQLLVNEFGVRSYVGAPLHVGGAVVGSLCAMDSRPRTYSPGDVARMQAFAERASRRLDQLAAEKRHDALGRAVAPALEEVRTILTPMLLGLGTAEAAVTELGVFRRVAGAMIPPEGEGAPVQKVLARVDRAHDDLQRSLETIGAAVSRLRALVPALEAALHRGATSTHAEDIVGSSTSLAHHFVKLVGGVEVLRPIPDAAVAVRRGDAVMLLSTVLTAVSAGRTVGPKLAVVATPEEVRFEVSSSELDDVSFADLAERFAAELPPVEGVALRAAKGRLAIVMRRA
ncbi:MAG: GAF domain-containing protein [Polyangiaceae bacterium]|nr:GAF domain-containing protein [Polyangiaceae bacterium]